MSSEGPTPQPPSAQEMKLDGNAIGGLLREIFTMEMTTAQSTCSGCGTVSVVGLVDVYMNAPGVVVRCPACEQVLMRIVRGRGRYWVDLRGCAAWSSSRRSSYSK